MSKREKGKQEAERWKETQRETEQANTGDKDKEMGKKLWGNRR